MPLERLPTMLHAVVDGVAVSRRIGGRLTLGYFFNVDSYSQGALYGLDKWKSVTVRIRTPVVREHRALDPERRQTFSGGTMGLGGTMHFKTRGMTNAVLARALHSGVRVYLAWTEKGMRRRTSFWFPIIAARSCNNLDPMCAAVLKMP
jgi:hypothetical protein